MILSKLSSAFDWAWWCGIPCVSMWWGWCWVVGVCWTPSIINTWFALIWLEVVELLTVVELSIIWPTSTRTIQLEGKDYSHFRGQLITQVRTQLWVCIFFCWKSAQVCVFQCILVSVCISVYVFVCHCLSVFFSFINFCLYLSRRDKRRERERQAVCIAKPLIMNGRLWLLEYIGNETSNRVAHYHHQHNRLIIPLSK